MRCFLQQQAPAAAWLPYFGLWHPAKRYSAARVRQMLQRQAPPKLDPPPNRDTSLLVPPDAEPMPPPEPMIYPHCHQGRLIFIRSLTRQQAMGP